MKSQVTLVRSLVVSLMSLVFLLAGCGTVEDEVLRHAEADLNCDENAITIRYMGGLGTAEQSSMYRAEGCEKSAMYMCSAHNSDWGNSYACCNAAIPNCQPLGERRVVEY